MKQPTLLLLIFALLFISSCKKDSASPVDPDIAALTKELAGSNWESINTQIYFGLSSHLVLYSDSVHCGFEKQFDIVQGFAIGNDLSVSNRYICSNPRTTFFEITKEKPDGSLIITERDANKNIIKVYSVLSHTITSSPPHNDQLWLRATIFDTSYFNLSNSGSLTSTPTSYFLLIQKDLEIPL